MPRYDYTCSECGRTDEFLANLDSPAPSCPDCGETMDREFPSPSLIGGPTPRFHGRTEVNQHGNLTRGVDIEDVAKEKYDE